MLIKMYDEFGNEVQAIYGEDWCKSDAIGNMIDVVGALRDHNFDVRNIRLISIYEDVKAPMLSYIFRNQDGTKKWVSNFDPKFELNEVVKTVTNWALFKDRFKDDPWVTLEVVPMTQENE